MLKGVLTCCPTMVMAQEDGHDWRWDGPCVVVQEEGEVSYTDPLDGQTRSLCRAGVHIGLDLDPIRCCPWCGAGLP